MIALMLWAAVAWGFILGFIFGDAEVRGNLLMLACFIALGAVIRVSERIRRDGK
jgi:hypothetical protein